MAGFRDFLKHGWSIFTAPQQQDQASALANSFGGGVTYAGRPDRTRYTMTNERSLIASVYTRLAVDAAAVDIRHVRLDKQGRYEDDVNSGLNNCLTLEANLDQTAVHFKQDMYTSLFDKGTIAVVPVETNLDPEGSGSVNIETLRIGTIVQWGPSKVKVDLYDERTGKRQEVLVSKKVATIVENPFYSVMNEPNSTLQRLIRKLNLLDMIDEQSGSGKLDIIIQLPYVIKSESMRQKAEQRRQDIEFQLKDSKYGIAYTDGTEKVTQLNRPAENNLLTQIEFLTKKLYSELGLTEGIMDGTADEATMLNYYTRTIDPVVNAPVQGMRRTFLTKTARTQGQTIMYFRDPFKLVPVSQLAEIGDKFTRNKIMTSNEFRGVIGLKPVKDPSADKLENSNVPQANISTTPAPSESQAPPATTRTEGDSQNGS